MELLIILCIFAAIVLASRGKKKGGAMHWKGVAHQLGLNCLNADEPYLTGQFGDRSVNIRLVDGSIGGTPQVFTRINVEFKQVLNTDFALGREGEKTDVSGLVGAQDIQIGHLDFDSVIKVQGTDEELVKQFFESRSARNSCLNVFRKSSYMRVKLSNRKLSISLGGGKPPASQLKNVLRHIVNAAIVLEQRDEDVLRTVKKMPPPLPLRKQKAEVPEEWHQEVEVDVVESVEVEPVIESVEAVEAVVDNDIDPDPIETRQVEEVIAADQGGIAVVDVAGELFEEKQGRYASIQKFDQFCKGESVSWVAELVAVVPVATDRNFMRDSGWIAIAELGEFPGMESGSGSLKVKFRIGRERFERIESSNPNEILIEGTLVKFDPFDSTLYVDSGDRAPTREQSSSSSQIISYSERLKKEMHSRPGEVRRFS